jgi:hypothetical protein
MFEKKEVWDKAAMYWQRGLLGLNRVYIAFHWNGDPTRNAAGKYAREYWEIPRSFEEHYRTCVTQGKLTPQQLGRIERLNLLWMEEMIDFEGGGVRTAVMHLAPEAERHGDFRLGEFARRGEARYYRVVVIPFHGERASACRKTGDDARAQLHQKRIGEAEAQAEFAEHLAKGNVLLSRLQGSGGPRRYLGAALHPQKVNPVSFQYLPRRLWNQKTEAWVGRKPEEVAAMLRRTGLGHEDENVRLTSVNVLAHLGDREAVRSALDDTAGVVRVLAARALARTRWAEGWAACALHDDPAVRATVTPLVAPVDDPRERAWVIGELVRGSRSTDAATARFSRASLEKITGTKTAGNQAADAWAAWWRNLGAPQPGLTRIAPDGNPVVDETVDFGTWWQDVFRQAPNPLLDYSPPTKITWTGLLVVPATETYRFVVRNAGENRTGANTVRTPGRPGFPGMFLSSPSATLHVDGETVLPQSSDCVQDPCGGVRLDFSSPVRLAKGLHRVQLEFDYRSRRDVLAINEPCVRLYWESDTFLREVVPSTHLVAVGGAQTGEARR